MLIKLETLELIKISIAYLLAYIPCVGFAGFIEAWLAKKFGDNTAQKEGFLTLNPLVHADWLFIVLLILRLPFGIARPLPMNPNNIQGRFKDAKLFGLFISRAISYLIFLSLTLFLVFLIHSKTSSISLLPEKTSSGFFVINLLFSALINLSAVSIIFFSIIGLVRFFVFTFLPNLEEQPGYIQFLIWWLPFFTMIIFGPAIEYWLNVFIKFIQFVFITVF